MVTTTRAYIQSIRQETTDGDGQMVKCEETTKELISMKANGISVPAA